MPVWQLAREIVREVYELTAKLPRCEDYALRGQTREAAVSIAGNIAEGFGRGHQKDKTNFYLYSRGSSCEVRSHLLMGVAAGYFSDIEITSITVKCLQVAESLNKLIKSLGSANTSSKSAPPQS